MILLNECSSLFDSKFLTKIQSWNFLAHSSTDKLFGSIPYATEITAFALAIN